MNDLREKKSYRSFVTLFEIEGAKGINLSIMEVSAEDNSGPESETKYNSVIEEKTPESFIEDIADDYVHYTKFDSAKEVNVHTILSNIRRGRGTSKRRMTACFPRNESCNHYCFF